MTHVWDALRQAGQQEKADDALDWYEERAAILQYCGELKRSEAEQKAYAMLLRRLR